MVCLAAVVLSVLVTGCEGRTGLQGAGATFPFPLYSKWMAEYQKLRPGVRINYQPIGSGGGIRQITGRTVDFGASDIPMTRDELDRAPGKLLHIPMTLGAVVISWNLPDVPELRLSPGVISGLFLGEIRNWNDPRIAGLNPGVALPDQPVTVIHRTDGSGTTAVFTAYLARVSPRWKETAGTGKSVKFPVGLGAKGNEGVSAQIRTMPGAVGYIELAYARQAGLPHAEIRNQAGRFTGPSPEAVTAAAASIAGRMPDDLRMPVIDPPGEAAYPIVAFSYILVYENQDDAVRGKALADFLWWAIHDGQKLAASLHYAPLPARVVAAAGRRLRNMRLDGHVLLQD